MLEWQTKLVEWHSKVMLKQEETFASRLVLILPRHLVQRRHPHHVEDLRENCSLHLDRLS